MKTFVALLRGINVGGRNRLPMKNLVGILGNLGAENVRTYVQSGNAIFRSDEIEPAAFSEKLATAIEASHNFAPQVFVLDMGCFMEAIEANPFPDAEQDPKSLHLGFLSSEPKTPDLDRLERLKKPTERFQLIGKFFYLHAPDGVGRSKLAAASEAALGVPLTDRNWKTVCKIKEMTADMRN